MGNKERIRYGRKQNRNPKNTLVTMEKDGVVYFGIARCNESCGDNFDKNKGKFIAAQRMALAIQENITHDYIVQPQSNLTLHRRGLRGQIKKENVKHLISYFESIDLEKPGHVLTDIRWMHS